MIAKATSHRYSAKVGALKNLSKFIGKDLCPSLSFNKVAG